MENDKLIRLPIIYDAGGDLKKEWFIEFYVRNPKTNVLQRQRVKKGINSFHTLQGRYAAAEKMKNHWKDKLAAEWSPYTDENVVYLYF